MVDVDLTVNNSVCDQRAGILFFFDCDITSKNTIVAVKSQSGGSTSAVFDGCKINAVESDPIFAGNVSSSGTRRGSINNFIGVYNTEAIGNQSIFGVSYYANEYQAANEVAKANQNKLAISIQGSSITADTAVDIAIESLIDKNNANAFAEGFAADTNIYIDGSTFDVNYLVSSDDQNATANANKAGVSGAYSANTNVIMKRSNAKTGNYAFSNKIGTGSDNGATTVTLYDGVKLTTKLWARESDSAVNIEFPEGVKLAYSYDAKYPYIATLKWTEDTLVGDGTEIITVELAPIFAEGMVLQGHKDVNVYGTCNTIGAIIEVKIGDVVGTTTVGGDFKWCVTLPPLEYANGVTICVKELSLTFPEIRVENVNIGEIWMMSGQSNSVYGVYKMEDFEEYRKNADNFDNIYAFAVNQGQSLVEKTEAKNSGWYKVSAANLTNDDRYTGISAIAYVMATRLATELGDDVAIGIVDINFNGSTVEAWASPERLAEVDPVRSAKYQAYRAYYEKTGTYPPESAVSQYGTYIDSGKLYQKMSCSCYNAMIAPFFDGFSIRGAVWDQGGGNASSVTADSNGEYDTRFEGVRNTFRDAFADEELPMFIIQLPPRLGNPFYFRALQYELAKNDENTYVVMSNLAGSTFTDNELKYTGPLSDGMAHYERKSPVGLALADSVLENVYGMGQLSAPKILSIEKRDGAIVITFDRELTYDRGSEMLGFDIAGPGTEWVAAKATYADKVVTLTAEGVSDPTRVRYGAAKSILVLEDGTELIYNNDDIKFTHDKVSGIVTMTVGDQVYTIHTSDPEVVGGRTYGNVVATNGTALPVFLATVE